MREDGQRTCFTLGKIANQGQILLYDDMEHVLKWGSVPGLGNGNPVRTNGAAYQGNYGIQISARQVFPDGWAWAFTGRPFGLRGHKRIEASVVFRRATLNPSNGWRIYVWHYDGSHRFIGAHSAGFVVGDYAWHQIILTLDLELEVYGPCYLDGKSLGKEGDPLSKMGSLSPQVSYIILGTAASGFLNQYTYFDLAMVREV